MLNQLSCRSDVLTHVFELSMETSAEGCLQGADTRGDYPIKVMGVLVGKFENTPKRYQNLVLWACPKFISTPKIHQQQIL